MSGDWISVDDRLPEDEVLVLVFCPDCTDDPIWFGYHDDDCWRYVDGVHAGFTITHWMELPEPPCKTGEGV